jgi:3-hydroxyisobutyrate dehydrogenase-like beta-hydroxyacid dehydrogenase
MSVRHATHANHSLVASVGRAYVDVVQIAFLGLGTMGHPMATRLATAGHDVTVWNRSPGRTVPGATHVADPGAAVATAAVVITMLSDPDAVREVLTAATPHLKPDTVVVEMSTIGPAAVTALAARLPARLVAAPVGGSVGKAAAGELTVFAGGDLSGIAGVLDVFGTVVPFDRPEDAAAAKLVVNTALVGGLALLGELRELADRLGVAVEPLLRNGPMAPFVARARGEGAHFTVALAEKDLGLVDHRGPLTEAALARLRTLVSQSGADLGVLAQPRTGSS